jgi:hypothetical protein
MNWYARIVPTEFFSWGCRAKSQSLALQSEVHSGPPV